MSVQPTPVHCRKCGALAGPPVYSDEHYGGRPALFWDCSDAIGCGYTWTLVIYQEPEVEIKNLRYRLKELEREAVL